MTPEQINALATEHGEVVILIDRLLDLGFVPPASKAAS